MSEQEANKPNTDLIDALVRVEVDRLGAIIDISTRFIVDRVKNDPTSVSLDPSTGDLLGALSEAAKFAKAIMARQIILKGGEPGHGL